MQLHLRKTVITLSILFFSFFSSQLRTLKFEDLRNAQIQSNKNVVVLLYTDWCIYCKAMKNTTFKKEKVVSLLNSNFYFIEMNAEEKNDVIFADRVFKYKPTGVNTGIHQLAEILGSIDGKISYPAVVFLNPENEIIFQYSGYISAADLQMLLNRLPKP
ncbi:MAG: thioredoxin family protein [Kaistella sp.]|nr:thioredoxin family protein [Kaistella sp.]